MNNFLKALLYFNQDIPDWFGWKKIDNNGDKIPNEDRMQYKYIEILDARATLPTEAEINAKIEELKQVDADKQTKKASGKQKLLDLGLTEEEVKALIGI